MNETGVDSGLVLAVAGITALAALAGAAIAAVSAGRRQRRALEAEQARQEITLGGERERLAQQLAHERVLTDMSELRALLDESASALAALERAYAGASASVTHVTRLDAAKNSLIAQGAPGGFVMQAQDEVTEALENQGKVHSEVALAYAYRERITIRLGEHPLVGHYAEAVEALYRGALSFPGVVRDPTEEELRKINQGVEAFDAARRSFLEEAKHLVGSAEEIFSGSRELPDASTEASGQ